MPNGYRRGGQVTRNGKTFQRRGTTYRMPTRTKAVVAVAGVAVGCAALGGGPLATHPVVLTGVIVGVAAVIAGAAFIKNGGAHRLRRKAVHQVKRSGKRAAKKAVRHARKRWATKPAPPAQPALSWQAREGHSQGRLLS